MLIRTVSLVPLKNNRISEATRVFGPGVLCLIDGGCDLPKAPQLPGTGAPDPCTRFLVGPGHPSAVAPLPSSEMPLLRATSAHRLQPLLISFFLHLLIIFLAFLRTLSCLPCIGHLQLAARCREKN